ncbi:hypothetical protein [Aliarcobacter butzleri]|uniref:hypothetical protein n=1 Tax=Aliarcobacter butzleri TaxID=28197 RepID=UPI00263D0E91|nr:hypothetical protein [Aliarcobacter butzleri]MDN5048590.1 hypothetical protein [Aliarcobacter butzleri]MDN5056692.1 hypothetical protein [Aliarcobacter butzleri]
MTYSTEIDTVSIQVDCDSLDEQQEISFLMSRAVTEYNKVYTRDNILTKEREILFNNNRIGIFRLGINPILNEYTRQYYSNYHIAVSFAGLKSYAEKLDNLSYGCLLSICGILNTLNIDYKFTELDICLDINTKIDNILVICNSKLPRTEYHLANHSFFKGDTVYIEKFNQHKLNNYSQRAYVYNKAKKENLNFHLTRFELKFQKSFFFTNELDSITIINALNRYTVMYFQNKNEKDMIVDKYNSYSRVCRRDTDKMGLGRYRLKADMVKIESFINKLISYRLY